MTSPRVQELETQMERPTILKGAKVVMLLQEGGRVMGVEYEVGGEKKTEEGSVVIATG